MEADVKLGIGDVFTMDTDRNWTGEDGSKHVHSMTVACVVTEVDERMFHYRVTGVEREVDRPAFAGGTPIGGSMAWFALSLNVQRGCLRVG